MSRCACWILLIVATLLVSDGCKAANESEKPRMTFEEADAQVEQLVREAAAQLPAGAELNKRQFTSLPCYDANDIATDEVIAERSYYVVHPAGWPLEEAVKILQRFWSGRGYRTSRNDLDGPNVKAYFVKNLATGVGVGIKLYPRQNGPTDMVITGGSPCVQAPLDSPVQSPSS